MNPGVRCGHRFLDPPSLQKDIFIINAKIYKTITQYQKDPEYVRYKPVIDRLNIINGYINELITYMLELDERERKLEEFKKVKKEQQNTPAIEAKIKDPNKLEIVLQDLIEDY